MPSATTTWPQALRWRLRRLLVDPPAPVDAVAVAERLCGVQAQVPSAAALAVAVRTGSTAAAAAADVERALGAGRLVRTWSVRGTLHLLAPAAAARQLSLLAQARSWHKGSWQRSFLPLEVVDALGPAVHDALAGGPLTREELAGAVEEQLDHAALAGHLRSGWSAVLKPLAWQGIVCQGPPRGRNVTFARPDLLLGEAWTGLPDPEAAGPAVVRDYLSAFGPATIEGFDAWLLRGASPKRRLRAWLAALGDEVAEVDVEGRRALVLRGDVDELLATEPDGGSVHLLPGFDQYVLGPGTGDAAIVAPGQRGKVSRSGGWISPVVLLGGRVAGTWEAEDGVPQIAPFAGADLPARALAAAVERMQAALGR